jgi:hypothetical protein
MYLLGFEIKITNTKRKVLHYLQHDARHLAISTYMDATGKTIIESIRYVDKLQNNIRRSTKDKEGKPWNTSEIMK